MRKLIVLALALTLVMVACGDDDDDTVTGDPGPAFVDDVQFVFMESDPVQVNAIITGHVPSPCHELVVGQTGDLSVEVSSAVDPETVCAQVLTPFEWTVELGAVDYGDHVLTVNDVEWPFSV